MQEGRGRMWRSQPEGDVRLMSDTVAMPTRPAGGSNWCGFHASPPRKTQQSHHRHHQQQQQVPVKTDTEEHIIQPKTPVSTTTPAAAAGQNPNVRRANAIDRYSRVVFPVVFTTFSITYWAVYINASSTMIDLSEFVID